MPQERLMRTASAEDFASIIAGLEATGLSRTEIAREAHLSRMTVWRLAEGEAREPSFRVVSSIERVYEQRVSALQPVSPLIQKML